MRAFFFSAEARPFSKFLFCILRLKWISMVASSGCSVQSQRRCRATGLLCVTPIVQVNRECRVGQRQRRHRCCVRIPLCTHLLQSRFSSQGQAGDEFPPLLQKTWVHPMWEGLTLILPPPDTPPSITQKGGPRRMIGGCVRDPNLGLACIMYADKSNRS